MHPATTQVNSALHPSGVAKSSTSFGWGKGRNVTSAGWQVTLCDPMWHVSSRSGVATLRTAIHLLLTYLLTAKIRRKRTRQPRSCLYLCQLFTDFKQFFTRRLSHKPFLIWLLTTQPHLKYVATLPCSLSLIAGFLTLVFYKVVW